MFKTTQVIFISIWLPALVMGLHMYGLCYWTVRSCSSVVYILLHQLTFSVSDMGLGDRNMCSDTQRAHEPYWFCLPSSRDPGTNHRFAWWNCASMGLPYVQVRSSNIMLVLLTPLFSLNSTLCIKFEQQPSESRRLENIIGVNLGAVYAFEYIKGSRR